MLNEKIQEVDDQLKCLHVRANKLTVLIIDDSEVIQERLSEMILEIKGINKVLTAGSALEGLKLAQTSRPDFIILDIKLPDMSGMEVLAEIKNNGPAPRVAILTNFPYPAYRANCMKLGADYFLDKSSEFSKVKEILMGLISEACE